MENLWNTKTKDAAKSAGNSSILKIFFNEGG